MSVGLRFTDGTNTVTVSNGTTGIWLGYSTKPNGGGFAADKASILLYGTLSTVRSTARSLQKLFNQAENRKKYKLGPRVFVERDLGDGVWWRSEVVSGVVFTQDDTWDMGMVSGKMPAILYFSRKDWWEGGLVQLALSNGSTTDTTGYITILNHDDAGVGHDNWVEIDGADVAGDSPSPARIWVLNNHNVAFLLYNLWIGHNYTYPSSMVHILEAESATGGTNVADAAASGGYYKSVVLASGAEADLMTWTLSSTLLNNAAGRLFRFMLAFMPTSAAVNETKYRVKIKYQNTLIWQSGQVAPAQDQSLSIVDVCTFRLPPWLQNEMFLKPVELVLSGEQETGSNKTLQTDFAFLMPLDGWRYIMPVGYGTGYGERVVDDATEEQLYIDDGAGMSKIGILVGFGKPIHLEPGKTQRLYFLQHENQLFTYDASRTAQIKIYYRPRVKVL